MTLVGACGDLWAHIQTDVASLVLRPHVLAPRQGEGKGEESPRLVYWPAVLVDWAWGTLNRPGFWVCGGLRSQVSICARQAELQTSTPPYQKTVLGNPCAAEYKECGLIRKRGREMGGGRTTERVSGR